MKTVRGGLGLLCLALASAACREKGRPDPSIRMAASHEVEQVPEQSAGAPQPQGGAMQGGGGQGQVAVPTQLEVPDAVKEAYSGIVFLWRDSSSGKEGKLEVPLGGSAPLAGSGLTVFADTYLPAFTMTSEVITSSGSGEENPAARIRVNEGDKEIFSGWIFKRFPDAHPFTHPRFALRLEGGIHKPGK
jgi:hypothetical protein